MCGRYTLTNPDPEKLRERFGLGRIEAPQERPRFNVAPSQGVLAVRRGYDGVRELARLRWGLVPHWAKEVRVGYKMINAKAETVAEKPAFRKSFERRRCLIPADGFFEWRRTEEGKQPVWVARADHEPFGFAGIWSYWQVPEGDPLLADEWVPLEEKPGKGLVLVTCSILTCAPNGLMRTVHDRMPVILDPAAEETWLDPEAEGPELAELIVPREWPEMELREVSTLVNRVGNEGPELIAPLPARVMRRGRGAPPPRATAG